MYKCEVIIEFANQYVTESGWSCILDHLTPVIRWWYVLATWFIVGGTFKGGHSKWKQGKSLSL